MEEAIEHNKVEFIERSVCPFEHFGEHQTKLKKLLTTCDFDTGKGNYDILYCPVCDIGFTSPYPSEETLHLLYLHSNSRNFDGNNSFLFNKLKDFVAKRAFINLKKKLNKKPEKILDFGTGNGRHSIVIKNVFKDAIVDAVDFNHNAPQLLENNNDVTYYYIEDFYKTEKKYDLILLRHVLEHVINPVEFLEKFQNYLEKDGVLLIEVPNLNAGIAKVFHKYYPWYYVPYHIMHYTKSSLNLILTKAGYKCSLYQGELPAMSNVLANMLNIPINNYLRFFGVLLNPVQIIINKFYNESSVLGAYALKND